ncbi:MAG TPA: hypothetical protein VGM88_29010 [Kofleriaceae bacterium]|jgi:hypothetical protein
MTWRLVALAALAAACSKHSKPNATPDFFGKTIVPPGKLAALEPGTPMADAAKLAGDLLGPCKLSVPSGVGDITLEVSCGSTNPPVAMHVAAHVKKGSALATPGLRPSLESVWGKPADTVPNYGWAGDRWYAELDPEGQLGTVNYSPLATTATFGTTPASLPAGLESLRPGMKRPDLQKLASEQMGFGTLDAEGLGLAFVGLADATGLSQVQVRLHTRDVALVQLAWGAPQSESLAPTHVQSWLSPATGWRADLTIAAPPKVNLLRYVPYTPLSQLLAAGPAGDGPQIAMALLGKSPIAPVQHMLPHDFKQLAATEFATTNVLRVKEELKGPVTEVELVLGYESPAAGAALKQVLDTMWGAPKGGVYRDANPHIEATDTQGAWHVTIR